SPRCGAPWGLENQTSSAIVVLRDGGVSGKLRHRIAGVGGDWIGRVCGRWREGTRPMIGHIFTVGGLTLISRLTGFARDVVLAAMLGAGPIADAFFVALRLPNHFRAIFAEGAFNAAFVPAYARVRQQGGAGAAGLFADRIFTLLFAVEIALLALALIFTPGVIGVLAPGLDPQRFELATAL